LTTRLSESEATITDLRRELQSAESEVSLHQGALEQAQTSSRDHRQNLETTKGRLKSIETVNLQLIGQLKSGNQQAIIALQRDLLEAEAKK